MTFEQGNPSLDVLLYEFADADGAAAYAEHLADRIGATADRRAPRPPSGGSFEIVVRCGQSTDCSHADEVLALAAHDRFLVAVTADDPAHLPADQLLSRARQVLQAQIDHLGEQGT